MIEMYKGYIESRDKCLTVQGFFLMIIIQWSTGLSHTFNNRNTCLENNAKNKQMCNFVTQSFFVILLLSNNYY